jgi:glycosyltransferase involved in cell wall biosynthesis
MIESFLHQPELDSLPYELLVVDNNSRDGTREMVHEYLSAGNIRYLYVEKQGLSIARNQGASESSGDILAFLDDDVIVGTDWLSALLRCYEATKADIVGGRTTLAFEDPPPEWLGPEFMLYLSMVDMGEERKFLPDCERLFGVNLSMRKEVLQLTGGFDESLGRCGSGMMGGEEICLTRRFLSLAPSPVIVYEPGAAVRHVIGPERTRWDYFVSYAKGHGKTLEAYEPKRSFAWQLMRCLKSLTDYLWAGLVLIFKRRFTKSAYGKKSAEYFLVCGGSHLRARLNRLKSCFLSRRDSESEEKSTGKVDREA